MKNSPYLPLTAAAGDRRSTQRFHRWRWLLAALVLITGMVLSARASDEPPKPRVIAPGELRTKAEAEKAALKAATPKITTEQLKETIEKSKGQTKNVQLVTGEDGKKMAEGEHAPAAAKTRVPMVQRMEDTALGGGHGAPTASLPVMAPAQNSRQYIRARAAALTGHAVGADAMAGDAGDAHQEVHWAYEGEGGPQAWGKLNPEFNPCAVGKRQSPINIEEAATLQGPAEPLQINYRPSNGTVVNNGHAIQVDVDRGNLLTVRGSTYELQQLHFHLPSEERVNFKSFAMVAHLVHKNAEGQLAVIGVLIEPGEASSFMQKVFTYLPLESGDKVRMPAGLVDLNELLPKDLRYYQFMGSLTTPPCSEGVLWMVLKQPVTAGREQIHLFSQLFPNNARPTQPTNGRVIRSAQ